MSVSLVKALAPVRCQAITYTNADFLSIGPLGSTPILVKFESKYKNFPFKKIYLKMSSAKLQPFCSGLNEI